MEWLIGAMLMVMIYGIVVTILAFARMPRRPEMRVTLIGAVATLIGIGLLIAAGLTGQGSLTIEIVGLLTFSAFLLLLIGAFAGFEKEVPET